MPVQIFPEDEVPDGVHPEDHLSSINPFGLNNGEKFILKFGNGDDRITKISNYSPNDFDQRMTITEDKNEEQDARLDALESAPVLPSGTQQTERLLWDVPLGKWIKDQGQAILGRNVVDDLQNSVVIGENINITNEKSVVIGSDISGVGENSICLNTGSAITSVLDNNIFINTDTVNLKVNNIGSGTIPTLLGTIDSTNYFPQSMTSLFDKSYPATRNGQYLYWDSTNAKWTIGGTNILLGQDAGLNATFNGACNVAIGVNAMKDAQNIDDAVVVGCFSGKGVANESVVVGNFCLQNSDTIGSTVLGYYSGQTLGGKNTVIGYRLGFDASPTGKSIGVSSVVIGSDLHNTCGFGSIAILASNTVHTNPIPLGTILFEGHNISLKMNEQPSGNYILGSTDGKNYEPQPLPQIPNYDFTNMDETQIYGQKSKYTYLGATPITKGSPVMLSGVGVKEADSTINSTNVAGIATNNASFNQPVEVLRYGYMRCKANIQTVEQPDLNVRGADFLMFVNTATDGQPATDDARTVVFSDTRTVCRFLDDGGAVADYQSSLSGFCTFDSGLDTRPLYVNPTSWKFEATTGGTTLYDNLCIAYSTDGITYQPLNSTVAPSLAPYLYWTSTAPDIGGSRTMSASNFGGQSGISFTFGDTSLNPDKLGNDPSGAVGIYHRIDARYVRFYFFSDSTVREKGWEIDVCRGVLASPNAQAGMGVFIDRNDYTSVKGQSQLTLEDTLIGTIANPAIVNGEIFCNIDVNRRVPLSLVQNTTVNTDVRLNEIESRLNEARALLTAHLSE